LALISGVLVLAACASPAPVAEIKPAPPLRFAEPILPVSVPPPTQVAPSNASDSLPPGYHCHWLSPGKKYCHGGMD
jgi:hypothetical protein